ncbi:Peptidase A1 domain-containing protein [Fusarium sp. LHS14.1]|nr:Peptidase A1 domain-containing protein [Fusarium sp. LHS14.1]
MWTAILGSSFLLVTGAQAGPSPLLLSPSQWKGIDGNWSTISFSLGSNSQAVDVLVSTALSEFWAVGSGGCLPREPHCSAARGGIYEPEESTDWRSLGTWELGLSYLGYGGNGEYGRDRVTTQSSTSSEPYSMDGVLMAAVNTTSYLNGLFGLGIIQGNFNGTVADSPLTQAVKDYGWIPSYSFGYTAGAHYRNAPVSLTLGGYEPSRFKSHNSDFTLTQPDSMERTLVRGIEIMPVNGSAAPDSWGSESMVLSEWDTSFDAIFDSSTPYLWLPDDVCDQFAAALNLTYNSTFDLYLISNEQYREYSKADTLSLTFVLSSFDNNDNFGDPYDVSGVVNITLPLRAFVSLLQYPFMEETIKYGEPAVPYFMLRKAHNSTTYILGRSFLQESYLITKYDEGIFSIHQALFPEESSSDPELIAIGQPDNSPYPPPFSGNSRNRLSKGAIAGIGVGSGVFVACVAALVGWLCYRRKRKGSAGSATSSEDDKDLTPGSATRSPKSPIMQLLSKLTRRGNSESARDGKENEKISEAPNTQIYEMPAPIPPAELDGDDGTSWNGDTELGTDSSQGISAYEAARRKLDRQLQGPVPAYTPPTDGTVLPPEKAIYQPNPANTQPRALQRSPTPSTGTGQEGNSNPTSIPLPSPMTPGFDATGRPLLVASPMTATYPVSPTHDGSTSPTSLFPPSSDGQTNGSSGTRRPHSGVDSFSASNTSLNVPQPQTVQRTPIDPSKVVFLGPLPGNARFSRHDTPRITLDQSHQDDDVINAAPDDEGTVDSLGSNFTVEEEERQQGTVAGQVNRTTNRSSTQARSTRLSGMSQTAEPDTPRSQERIDGGNELVHVPQLAERRYSWEEER